MEAGLELYKVENTQSSKRCSTAGSHLEHSCNCCWGAHTVGVPHRNLIASQLKKPGGHICCRCWGDFTLQGRPT